MESKLYRNNKIRLKLYSLALTTSMIFSSSYLADINQQGDIRHEYPWTGGTMNEDEIIDKSEKGKFLRRKK